MSKKPTPTRSPFSPRAARVFTTLDPRTQALMLQLMCSWASPRLSPGSLYATEAQRRAAKQEREELAAERAADDTRERERIEIQRKLNALHNRAQTRRAKGDYLTPAQRRRFDALIARLNVIDGVQ